MLSTGAAGATGADGRIIYPEGGETLISGRTVSIHWHAPPAAAEEMEILLVLDDASGTTLRLTRQLSPRTTTYAWQVPNLPSRSARLLLRYGHDGVEHECEPSEPFAIIGSPGEPLAAIAFHAGEWWLGKTSGSSTAGCVSGNRPHLGALPATAAVAVLPVAETLAGATQQQYVTLSSGEVGASPHSLAVYGLPRQPMDVPLRP